MSTVAGDQQPSVPSPLVGVTSGGRRRRPSGEPPPLPRHVPISTFWNGFAVLATVLLEAAMAVEALRRRITAVDDAVVRAIAHLRTPWLTSTARAVEQLGGGITLRVLAWSTIAALLLSRRFRHLVTYLGVLVVVVALTGLLGYLVGRMRPTGVTLLGPWSGFANPSAPVAVFAAAAVGACYTLVPRGRNRRIATVVTAVLVALLAGSRLYLGVDHPSDQLAALGIGWAAAMVAFRMAAPEEAFPVRYRRGRAAHLDLTTDRCSAIGRALAQQLGISVVAIEAFGLGSSAGSTPLRIVARDADGNKRPIFGKLYAGNHLRADRSYKLTRMVLYGRLEDEKPFSTVRRLTEYEDHMLRLLRDNGLPVPAPLGFVEITPEREYLIVMDFLADAENLGDHPLGTAEIDSGLQIVRRLWQAGVAHRDIKPSNLLVKDGKAWLIDVAFATVRPTPWRQAVDLANMMLTLALASDAPTVYAHAARIFAPEDIAEAFAACRSITLPTQLRARLRRDGRDLIGEFCRLAPARATVRIQVWTLRRIAVTATLMALGLAAVAAGYMYVRVAGLL